VTYKRLSKYLVTALQNDISKVPTRGASLDKELLPAIFLLRWSHIATSNLQKTFLTSPPSNFFTSELYQPPDDETPGMQTSITEISVDVPRELSDPGTHTILDALENVIHFGSKPACVRHFGSLLLLKFRREDREGGIGVEILPKLGLARFALENYEEAIRKLRMRDVVKDTLEKLRRRQDELTWMEKGGKKFNAVAVLETTIEYCERMEGKSLSEGMITSEDDEELSSRMEIDSEAAKLPVLGVYLKESLQLLQQQLQGIPQSQPF
jgi:hypothetical protein